MCKVLNTKVVGDKVDAVYVGRPSRWGNPFLVGRDGAEGECAALFREHLWNSVELLRALPELFDRDLRCWCKPAACHADHLLAAARWAKSNPDEYRARLESLGAEQGARYSAQISERDEDGNVTVSIFFDQELVDRFYPIRYDHADQWAAQELECLQGEPPNYNGGMYDSESRWQDVEEPMCASCGVKASSDPEAVAAVKAEPEEYASPADYVREDGTYNPEKNMYACTPCYIKMGQPSGPAGWTV